MLTNITRRSIAPLLALALVAAACGKKDEAADQAGRDIVLAPQDSSAAINDAPAAAAAPAPTPAMPKPVAPKAATPTKAPTSSAGSIGTGTSFSVANGARICTNTHKAGATFTAILGADVTGTRGAKIPAGSVVTLRVTESAISKNSKDNWKLAFAVASVTIGTRTLDVQGDVTSVATIEAVRSQSTGQQVGKVATGAAIGAIAGQLLGKDTKGTVAGAAVGAVAGGAVAAATTDYEGCLPANGRITVRLSAPLVITAN